MRRTALKEEAHAIVKPKRMSHGQVSLWSKDGLSVVQSKIMKKCFFACVVATFASTVPTAVATASVSIRFLHDLKER